MKMTFTKYPQALIMGLALHISGTPALAGEVTIPTTFASGTPAVAAEVNGNFTAVKTAVDDNAAEIAALKTANAELKAQLNNIMALNPYITVNTAGGIPNVTFSGINMQVVNGMGSTATVNGTGNLIVGYNEAYSSSISRCTVGGIAGVVDQVACEGAGGTWTDAGFKTGSHYIVAGSQNNYSSYGGVVFGYKNTSNYNYAGVSGGYLNTASGSYSNVSGGRYNVASGTDSNVSGGRYNVASGTASNVSGGSGNTASGNRSNVSGGQNNTAGHLFSSILGGITKSTSADYENIPIIP